MGDAGAPRTLVRTSHFSLRLRLMYAAQSLHSRRCKTSCVRLGGGSSPSTSASERLHTSRHAVIRSLLGKEIPGLQTLFRRNIPDASRDQHGMKNILVVIGIALSALGSTYGEESAPKHEIGLTLGGLLSNDRNSPTTHLILGSGVALQANYGYRVVGGRKAALYGEVHLLANPLRDVSSSTPSLTRDVATLFVTPGVRLKLFPASGIAPYLAAGGGWALFEQSTATLAGGANPASRNVNRGAFDYGGGIDFKFWRFVGLRAEIRDFYTGSPAYNSVAISGGQHNVVAGGGLVLKFR